MNKIILTERKQLSPEFTVVWYWFDRIDENSQYRFGTDENIPSSGLYQYGRLVSTVNWNQSTVTLEQIQKFLDTTDNPQQLMPGINWRIPESI